MNVVGEAFSRTQSGADCGVGRANGALMDPWGPIGPQNGL